MFRARNLSKSFGSLQVVRDVSLDLPRGRRQGVIGPNGAGKTTLFNLLTGELKADSGQVYVEDRDISNANPDARARSGLGRSFQKNNLFSESTVRENLVLAALLQHRVAHHWWRNLSRFGHVQEAAEEGARLLGLQDDLDTEVRHLSYGTQRQLEIGLALMLRPKVLMLDEPTSGMSQEETRAIQRLIVDLPSDLTVLIIEHDMDVVFEFAERITVLDYGSVLMEGTPAEIRGSEEIRRKYFGATDGFYG
uniref:Amino acid/amide ABC transporter ATP-binding protein 1, HAAT family n=1 Tax=Candidatus Kentrum sp. FW TaxID=2126338 RepID=A0A450TTK1_9GAMM|nr:MAG: amino acid/amide ABC transporter ATP-binding protein 1, HAAT family [Candidatus Kentron sp. FW]